MIIDCDHFKSRIKEEFEDAKTYAKAALEIKATNPSWSKTFLEMSGQELVHAKNIYDMFKEYYEKIVKPYQEAPKYYRDMKSEIDDMFAECYSSIKYMQELAK